jgi:hypothetical protein
MSFAESGKVEGILDELRTWPSSERLRLARLILETIDTQTASPPARKGTLKDLLGLLKTDEPPPNDDECRAILDEELINKQLKWKR